MSRVVHFEIHAENPERAIRFYTNTFGWKFTEFEGPEDYWVVVTGSDDEPGINGGLIRRKGELDAIAVIAYVCTIQVESLNESVETLLANGGKVVVPRMAIPGSGWLAYCKDTEGNIFGIIEKDPDVR